MKDGLVGIIKEYKHKEYFKNKEHEREKLSAINAKKKRLKKKKAKKWNCAGQANRLAILSYER